MNEDTQSHLRMEATDRLNGLGGRRRRPKKVNMSFTLGICCGLMLCQKISGFLRSFFELVLERCAFLFLIGIESVEINTVFFVYSLNFTLQPWLNRLMLVWSGGARFYLYCVICVDSCVEMEGVMGVSVCLLLRFVWNPVSITENVFWCPHLSFVFHKYIKQLS